MKRKRFESAFEWLESLALGLVTVIFVFVFVAKIYTVVGDSMYDTLKNGEKVAVYQLLYTPEVGDIVVVDSHSRYGKTLVKRVIATEHQQVNIDMETGALFVDGQLIETDLNNARGDISFPVVVPEGHLFVMGDNRGGSLDSRYSDVGMIHGDNIVGRVFYRIYPFGEMGGL